MANMSPKKNPIPEQDPNVRNKNFEEVAKENKADMAIIINNQLNNVEVINLNSNTKSTMKLVKFLENFK